MLGIIVDRVFDTEEIVVKPVAPILRHVTMFSGNTILGDGSVIMILDPNGIARGTGIGAGGDEQGASRRARSERCAPPTAPRCCCSAPAASRSMAVPLGLVARLEDIPRDKIEISCGAPVTQYRGKLMPLVALSGSLDTEKPRQPVLVFTDGDRSMGLMVDEIIDVVEDRLNIELSGARPGLLGTAVIGGHATDVIDTGYWLTQAWQDWFHGSAQSADNDNIAPRAGGGGQRLLPPARGADPWRRRLPGHRRRRVRPRRCGCARRARCSTRSCPTSRCRTWTGSTSPARCAPAGRGRALPMIALSARTEPADIEAGRDAGFTDYVAKFQREALIASLRQCLAEPIAA